MSTISYIANGIDQTELDGSVINTEIRYAATAYLTMCAHATSISGTWSAAILTWEWSNNGVDWFAFPTAVALTSAAPSTGILDISAYVYVRVRVSTIEASRMFRIGLCMKGDS